MPSKKRGGLSAREYAAEAKKKAAPKLTRSVASKSPWGSAGDAISGEGSMTNDQYENKIAQGLGAKTAALARTEAKLTSSPTKQREAAAKAQKSKMSKPQVLGASAPSLLGTQSSVSGTDTLSGESANSGFLSGIGRKIAGAGKFIGDTVHLPDFGMTERIGANNFMKSYGYGIPTANASDGDMSALGRALQASSEPDMPTTPGQSEVNDIFGDLGQPKKTQPFQDPTYQSSGSQLATNNSNNDNKKKDWVNPWGDVDISGESMPAPTQEEITQQNNDLYGNQAQAPVDQASPRVTNQVRGSGLFGTGKGVGNTAGGNDDPYIKELRKAYSSNGGEKWLRKQFEELISQLDPTYAQMQREGTDALNQQLWNNNTQLASVMNANNTGDSEQRAQLMAGQQRDSNTALGNLLAKLAQSKAGDVSQYKGQMASQMGQLKDRNQSNQQKLMEQIQQYQNQRASGASRGSQPENQKLSRNDVFNWAEDALNKGYSWAEIAENAKEQGIGTETGGYLDQLLNNANKQNRYR